MPSVLTPGSPHFVAAAPGVAPETRAALDAALATLQAHKLAWVATSVPARIALLDQVIATTYAAAPRWVAACVEAKGAEPGSPAVADEWEGGPYSLLRNLRQLRVSLENIALRGYPRVPGPVYTLPNGQLAAQTFPANRYDALLFAGVVADVWMEPGVTAAELPATQAVVYHTRATRGRVALVLGAGNISSIPAMDVLYKLFVENQVVLLKTNPVNAYLGPLIAESFAALVSGGFLRVVAGDAAEGAYLCAHPAVDEVHITGSDKTFDAIVFGTGPEGQARKAAGRPLLEKRVTGELGNVSPVIVVPGAWSKAELDYQAEHLASMLVHNAGFNCATARVIVTHAGWPLREPFLRRVGEYLAATPPRTAFYPGAHERHHLFSRRHGPEFHYGDAGGEALPWTFITGLDPESHDEPCFKSEAFCSLMAETALPAASTAEYLDRAVAFANDTLWGTLAAAILVHPASVRSRAASAAFTRALENLRYGTVSVNYMAVAAYGLATTPWGAFPGHPLNDIQSGTGFVHNTLMFSRAQKTVLRAPFRVWPRPLLFISQNAAALAAVQKMCALEAEPGLGKLPGVVRAALG